MEQNKITRMFSVLLSLLLFTACSTPQNLPPFATQPTQDQAPALTGEPATGAPTEPAVPGTGETPIAGDSLCSNAYYPVRQNATWSYRSTGSGGEYGFTDTITSVREDGFTLATQAGDVSLTQEWRCQADGLVALQFGGAPAAMLNAQNIQLAFDVSNPSGVTFPREIRAGDQWQLAFDLAGEAFVFNEEATVTGNAQNNFSALGMETVTVPAGTFEALKLQVDTTLNLNASYEGITLPAAFTITYTYWFAPGVGWVKSTGTGSLLGSTFSETTELQSYNIS